MAKQEPKPQPSVRNEFFLSFDEGLRSGYLTPRISVDIPDLSEGVEHVVITSVSEQIRHAFADAREQQRTQERMLSAMREVGRATTPPAWTEPEAVAVEAYQEAMPAPASDEF